MTRTKGSKSKLGIPSKSITEAIDLVKKAYEKAGENTMSIQDITEFMNLAKGSNYPVIGILASDYGLIEKEGLGYRISDIGKKVIKGDKSAIKESFEKNAIFRDLSSKFWGKKVTSGLIIDYLKRKYKKGENVNTIAQRFLEGINYIESLNGGKGIYGGQEGLENLPSGEYINSIEFAKITKLIKLRYALNPPKKEEVNNLIEDVCKEFKNDKNEAINSIISNIEKNKNNDQMLKTLFEILLNILTANFPNLKLLQNNHDESRKVNKKETESSSDEQ